MSAMGTAAAYRIGHAEAPGMMARRKQMTLTRVIGQVKPIDRSSTDGIRESTDGGFLPAGSLNLHRAPRLLHPVNLERTRRFGMEPFPGVVRPVHPVDSRLSLTKLTGLTGLTGFPGAEYLDRICRIDKIFRIQAHANGRTTCRHSSSSESCKSCQSCLYPVFVSTGFQDADFFGQDLQDSQDFA